MSSFPSSHLSSALWWGMDFTAACPAVPAAAGLLGTWCCSPLWLWLVALTALSMWGTSTSFVGSIPMVTPEPYWNSSETCFQIHVKEFKDHYRDLPWWIPEHRIDLSTIKTKLARQIWVSKALTRLALAWLASAVVIFLISVEYNLKFVSLWRLTVWGSDITDSHLPL